MNKLSIATIWLDGCSGCHMSFLDIDDKILQLVERYDILYSPLIDIKDFPQEVDVTLVEGAISTDEDVKKIEMIRKRTKTLIAFGDCAVTANVPAMRNRFSLQQVIDRGYIETTPKNKIIPNESVPKLLDKAYPVCHFIDVDHFLQGCPPSADLIFYVLTEIAEGRKPEISERAQFG